MLLCIITKRLNTSILADPGANSTSPLLPLYIFCM